MRVAILGYGNLGWNLEKQLTNSGVEVSQILTNDTSSSVTFQRLDQLDPRTELLFVCKSDSLISGALESLSETELNSSCIVAHTSGSVSLQNSRFRDAVFYPFQTFTKEYRANWNGVPVFIETEIEEVKSILSEIVMKIDCFANELDSHQRKRLHIAGVFSSNFPNHLIRLMFDYLKASHLESELIKPLLTEAVRKSFDLGPKLAQTGPAVRGDDNVIKDHLKLLEEDPELHALYTMFTDGIQNATQ